MNQKMVLREFFALCPGGICQDFLTESEKRKVKDGAVYLTGVIQAADRKNGNGRVYPRRILEREIEMYERLVKERRSVGELDHPDDSVVNLKNVSHVVTDVWWRENDVMGKVEVLDTPSGKILKSLVNSGIKLGISSRGLGSVKKEMGQTLVEEDFQLICFDIVQEPSTEGAFLHSKVVYENKQPNIFNKSDRMIRTLNDILG